MKSMYNATEHISNHSMPQRYHVT